MKTEELAILIARYNLTDTDIATQGNVSERNARAFRLGEKHMPKDVEQALLRFIAETKTNNSK